MTLFIKLPIHCRDNLAKGNPNDSNDPKDSKDSNDSNESRFGSDYVDGSKEVWCCNEGVVESSRRPNDNVLVRTRNEKENEKEGFLSDPDLASNSFPQSSSSPRLTILASPRPVSERQKATSISGGTRLFYVETSLDSRVAGALLTSCRWKNFRQNLISSILDIRDDAWRKQSSGWTEVVIFVNLRRPTVLSVDAAFGRRVLGLLHDRLDLEVAMAWLSTLGGGFSALGDYYGFAAEKAQKISLAQMKLALDMGDPIVTAKSWLWFSLALIQKGQIHAANTIVKKQLAFSRTKIGKLDPRLRRMCKGVMSKIQYMGRDVNEI